MLYPAVLSLLLCASDRTKISPCSVAIEKRIAIVEEKTDEFPTMDMFTNSNAWLQQQQQQQQPQQQAQSSDPHPVQRPSVDWKEPSTSGGNNAPPSTQGNIDLSDFGLGDLSGEHHQSLIPYVLYDTFSAPQQSPSLSSPPPFFGFPQHYFLSTLPGPYNAMGYGTSSWSNQPGQVPLSNYSTLNGATTSNPTPQSQQSSSQQMIIECAVSFYFSQLSSKT